jgi:hypothetical protein
MRSSNWLSMAALMMTAQMAWANEPVAAANDPSEIIVQGNRNSKQTVSSFIRKALPARFDQQFGKFESPACPRVIGLPEDQNRLVERRIRTVADAVGAPVEREGCSANLFVLLGRDKREIIAGLKQDFPTLTNGIPAYRLRSLAESPAPVASWQVVDFKGSNGVSLGTVRSPDDMVPKKVASTVGSPSRLTKLVKPHFLASVVVIEGRALRGMTTTQIADYAAMRSLAPTDSTKPAKLPAESILTLFEPAIAQPVEPSLTWWDYALLKALYASSNEVIATSQQFDMRQWMLREMKKALAEQ